MVTERQAARQTVILGACVCVCEWEVGSKVPMSLHKPPWSNYSSQSSRQVETATGRQIFGVAVRGEWRQVGRISSLLIRLTFLRVRLFIHPFISCPHFSCNGGRVGSRRPLPAVFQPKQGDTLDKFNLFRTQLASQAKWLWDEAGIQTRNPPLSWRWWSLLRRCAFE